MTDHEIIELAAILVNEYGHAALDVAERRRDQHAHKPNSDSHRVWSRIAAATARLLRASHHEPLPAGCSGSGGMSEADQRGRST